MLHATLGVGLNASTGIAYGCRTSSLRIVPFLVTVWVFMVTFTAKSVPVSPLSCNTTASVVPSTVTDTLPVNAPSVPLISVTATPCTRAAAWRTVPVSDNDTFCTLGAGASAAVGATFGGAVCADLDGTIGLGFGVVMMGFSESAPTYRYAASGQACWAGSFRASPSDGFSS